jgi:membrane-associated phospholipid phosphatase
VSSGARAIGLANPDRTEEQPNVPLARVRPTPETVPNTLTSRWVDWLAVRLRLPAPVMVTLLIGLTAAAVLGGTGVRLADAVMDRGGRVGTDASVLTWMVGHRDDPLTVAARIITTLGATVTLAAMTALAVAVLFWRGPRGAAVLVAVTSIGAGLLVVVAKHLVGRDRPPAVAQLVVANNSAFPSGHALGSTAVLGVLTIVALGYVRSRLVRVVTVVAGVALVVLIGLSRVYLGVHWASDVAAGWLLGGAWLSVCLTGSAACHSGGQELRSIPAVASLLRHIGREPAAAARSASSQPNRVTLEISRGGHGERDRIPAQHRTAAVRVGAGGPDAAGLGRGAGQW